MDTSKPAEFLLFDFLTEKLAAAVEGEPLYDIELHDTIWQSITKKQGIRLSDTIGDMSPGTAGEIREYNVNLQIVCFAKVEDKYKKERQDAMTAVWNIQKAVYRALVEDPSMGGRGCDILPETGARSYDVFNGNPYAIAVIPVVINKASGA